MSAKDFEIAVSVIIPTKNEAQVIHECLSSVFNQSLKPMEVIIVDGKSTDNTLKEAQQFPVKIITETEPTSLPNARNLGIMAAKGDIILIMDADIILEKNCVRNAVNYFEDPLIIAVVPCEQNTAHSRLEKIQIDWIRGGTNPLRPGIGISVFAEFLRKSVFTNLRFDPKLGYGEDEDFQHRLLSLYGSTGKVIRSSDSIISVHYCHTLTELRSQYTWYGRTFKTFLRKKNYLSKALLNLGSLIAPLALIIFGFLSIIVTQALPFFLLLTTLIIARNLLICYRSRSLSFFEFVAFEFLRSLFFTRGLLQGLFSKKRGR
jgi:glycosyltransferase involved in cell wall biosynthesis